MKKPSLLNALLSAAGAESTSSSSTSSSVSLNQNNTLRNKRKASSVDDEGTKARNSTIVTCPVCGVSHDDNEHAHIFTYVENDHYFTANDLMDSCFSLEPLVDPCVLPCGHMFSKMRGIREYLQSNQMCPLKCRGKVTVAKLTEAPVMVKNTVNKIKVLLIHVLFNF
jgi:hypothetical protein